MGLEKIVYQVLDITSAVEVCAILYSPNITCPIESNFSVNLSTSDGSAGMTGMMICMVLQWRSQKYRVGGASQGKNFDRKPRPPINYLHLHFGPHAELAI